MSVPLSTIKSALKIDYADDDTELIRLREAAWALIERRTQLTLSPSTLQLYLAAFNDSLIPGVPFTAVSSVTYIDGTGATQTLAATEYWIDRTDGPLPRIRFHGVKPIMKSGTAITVTYTAGFEAVPNEIVHAVVALVGAWYNNPEALQPIALQSVPMSLEFILETLSARSLVR